MLNHLQVECPEGMRISLGEATFSVDVDWESEDGQYVGQTSVSFLPCRGSSEKIRSDVLSACSRILTENRYTVMPPVAKLADEARKICLDAKPIPFCPTCGGQCGGKCEWKPKLREV